MVSEARGRLIGKCALVTGGSKGIGKAIARAYALEGARVFICGRNARDLDDALADLRNSGLIDGVSGDISRWADAQRIVAAAVTRFGAIDVLVNNASVLGPRVPIAEYPPDDWQTVIDVNLNGLFYLTRLVLQSMIPRQQGSIINVTSGVGRTGRGSWGAYSVSKFGVEGLTQVLADELKGSGIRVNAVNPNATRTGMRAAAYPEEDPATLPTPEEITELFVQLASDESVAVHGASLEARDWIRRAN